MNASCACSGGFGDESATDRLVTCTDKVHESNHVGGGFSKRHRSLCPPAPDTLPKRLHKSSRCLQAACIPSNILQPHQKPNSTHGSNIKFNCIDCKQTQSTFFRRSTIRTISEYISGASSHSLLLIRLPIEIPYFQSKPVPAAPSVHLVTGGRPSTPTISVAT
jgi:hypothetical protein